MHDDRVDVYIRHHVFVVVVERERLAFRRRRRGRRGRARSHRPHRFRPNRRATDVESRRPASGPPHRDRDALPRIVQTQGSIRRFQKRHRPFEPSIAKRRLRERVRVDAHEIHHRYDARDVIERRRVRIPARERVHKVIRDVLVRRPRRRRSRHLVVRRARPAPRARRRGVDRRARVHTARDFLPRRRASRVARARRDGASRCDDVGASFIQSFFLRYSGTRLLSLDGGGGAFEIIL